MIFPLNLSHEVERVASTDVPQKRYSTGRGRTHIKLNQAESARQDFYQSLKLDPQNADAYQLRGTARLSVGQKEKSIKDLDIAILRDLADSYKYGARVQANVLLGLDLEAQQDVDRAVELGLDRDSLQKIIDELKVER